MWWFMCAPWSWKEVRMTLWNEDHTAGTVRCGNGVYLFSYGCNSKFKMKRVCRCMWSFMGLHFNVVFPWRGDVPVDSHWTSRSVWEQLLVRIVTSLAACLPPWLQQWLCKRPFACHILLFMLHWYRGHCIWLLSTQELFGLLNRVYKSAALVRPGAAEVVYFSREDAIFAVEQYHDRNLDG